MKYFQKSRIKFNIWLNKYYTSSIFFKLIHSFEASKPIRVRVGSNNVFFGEVYDSEKLVLNEDRGDLYGPMRNDIALVKLKKSIKFNDDVQPIELATEELPEGAVLTVTGWGSLTVRKLETKFLENILNQFFKQREIITTPAELQFLNVTAISTLKCKEELEEYYHDSVLCTSTNAKEGICQVSYSINIYFFQIYF